MLDDTVNERSFDHLGIVIIERRRGKRSHTRAMISYYDEDHLKASELGVSYLRPRNQSVT